MRDVPAVLGGTPVFPNGLPDVPGALEPVRAALLDAWHDGSWGKYQGRHGQRLIEEIQALHSEGEAGGADPVFVELFCSATVAIEMALRAVGAGPGTEVVLAAYDYPGNLLNVLACGATPVLVDIDPESGQMDVGQAAEAITERTRAIIASHLHGAMVPVAQLRELADEEGVVLIEDAAQMPGAVVQGRRAGGWGHMGVISFGGSKLLSAGRGGALLTRDRALLLRVRRQAMRGPNQAFTLSELQAAVLVPQIRALDQADEQRLEAARTLARLLEPIEALRPFTNKTPGRPGFYKYGLWFDPAAATPLSREALIWALRSEGVPIAGGFRALHVGRSPRRFRKLGSLTHATAAHDRTLVLHHSALRGDPALLERLVHAMQRVLEYRSAVMERLGASGGD